jgi:hypothetical protein
LFREPSEERKMQMLVWQESARAWANETDRIPARGIAAAQWRRFVAWRLGGDDAALVDGYDHFVPVERIVVPLEAAATSPFMDA